MKPIIRIFIVGLFWLSACQPTSTLATTLTPRIDTPDSSTITSTGFVTATNTPTATAIPTTTPLYYSTPILLPSEVISTENIQNLRELASFGKGKVNKFSYSTDGKFLAVATMKGIYIYDAHTFIEQKYIPTDDSVNCVAFSPDGTKLASTFSRGSVQLWQMASGALLATLEKNTGHSSGSLLFSPDGSSLFSASGDAAIRAWRISDGKLMRTFRGSHEYSIDEMINSMSISPDGSLLATTDGYKGVWIWRVSTGELLHKLEGNHVVFSPDGKVLAVGKGYYSDDLIILLWQVPNWTLINTLSGHKGKILSMSFSPNGEAILVNDSWREAKLWNISNQAVSVCFQCGQKNFDFLSFSPDGSAITTLDWDGVLQIWNMPDGKLLHTFNDHLGVITSLTFSGDGSFLAASSTSSIGIWRISDSTLQNIVTYRSYNYANSQSIVFSPDSKFLAFWPFLNGLQVLNTNNLNSIQVLKDQQTISSLAFSPDGMITAIGLEQKVEFRQASDGVLLDTLILSGNGSADRLAYSRDGNFLAVGRYEKVEVWRIPDKTLVRTLKGIGYSINQVSFSPNGNIFATGTLNTAQWNGTNGKQLQSLPIRGHTFSPDLNIVATIEGGIVRFYRMSDGKLVATLRFSSSIHDVAFSPDGKLIGLAEDDGIIRILGISHK